MSAAIRETTNTEDMAANGTEFQELTLPIWANRLLNLYVTLAMHKIRKLT